jgi:hypothetical protein
VAARERSAGLVKAILDLIRTRIMGVLIWFELRNAALERPLVILRCEQNADEGQ